MSNSSCDHSESWWMHQHNAYVFAYKIVTPVYFVLGLIGHTLCLLAFGRQAKKESPYAYQIFLTISETLEIVAFTCFSLSFRWFSGIENEGVSWYQRNYALMFFAAHISFPLLNGFITTTLLLAVSMSADRVLAMARPYAYKNLATRKHQTAALYLSVMIGCSTSVFDAFRFHVVEMKNPSDGEFERYAAVGDSEYMQTLIATFLAHLRDAVRISGLLALITCNGAIVYLYHVRMRQVHALTGSQSEADRRRQAERQAAENTLLLLTITQSSLRAIGMTFLVAFNIMIYVDPEFLSCGGLFMAPCLDATLQLAAIVDFYFVLAVSKQFRRMIFSALKHGGGVSTSGQGAPGSFQRLRSSTLAGEQQPQH